MNSLKNFSTTLIRKIFWKPINYKCVRKFMRIRPDPPKPKTTLTINESNGVATLDLNHSLSYVLGSECNQHILNRFNEIDFIDDLFLRFKEIEKQSYRALIITSSVNIRERDIEDEIKNNVFVKKQTPRKFILRLERMCTSLYQLPIPTISAIKGHLIGGMCCLANACDYRFIESSAKIGFLEHYFGIVLPYFVSERMREILGDNINPENKYLKAKNLLYYDDALKINWVNDIVYDKNWDEKVNQKSEEMIKIPANAYELLKIQSGLEFLGKNEKYGKLSIEKYWDSMFNDELHKHIRDRTRTLLIRDILYQEIKSITN